MEANNDIHSKKIRFISKQVTPSNNESEPEDEESCSEEEVSSGNEWDAKKMLL